MIRASVSRPISSVPIGCAQLGSSKRRRDELVRVDRPDVRAEQGDEDVEDDDARADEADRVAPLAEEGQAPPRHRLPGGRGVAGALGREHRLGSSPSRAHSCDDPRVEDAVEDVHEQVGEDEGERDHQRHRLDDGVVAAEDRLQEHVADSGQPEDDLDDRGAADQHADLEADDRDHRDQGVPQRVLRDHGSPADALGPGGADVVLPEHLEHRRAHHAHHDRHREHRDRDRREDELAQVPDRVVPGGDVGERGDPAEDARREEQQQRREPEAGNAEPDQAADARAVVGGAVALDGGDDAERDADERWRSGARG